MGDSLEIAEFGPGLYSSKAMAVRSTGPGAITHLVADVQELMWGTLPLDAILHPKEKNKHMKGDWKETEQTRIIVNHRGIANCGNW